MTYNNIIAGYLKHCMLLLATLLVTASCMPSVPEGEDTTPGSTECIAADDWGDPKILVPAHKKLDIENGESIGNQTMPWKDSAQVLIDANRVPLIMSIQKGQRWTSWLNGQVSSSKICEFTTESCPKIVKSQGLSLTCKDGDNPRTPPDMVADCYVPCWINHAMGLYMLTGNNPDAVVYEDDSSEPLRTDDPNSQESYSSLTDIKTSRGINILATMDQNAVPVVGAIHSPDAFTTHLGSRVDHSSITADTRDIFLWNDIPSQLDSSIKTGDRLYFKIMDEFYADNAGSYLVRIHAGTMSASPGPLGFVAGTFEAIVNMVAEYLYKAIVSNVEFIRIVQAALILYIAIYGVKFMLGMDNTHNVGNFLVHIFKVAILLQLISPSSWEFFYVYLFRIFTEGITGLLGFLASPFAAYDAISPWPALDKMLSNFFSHETWVKISSLFFSHPFMGVFLVVALIVCLAFFLSALISAILIYIIAYMQMGFLMILFPILLIFIILKRTKWIFDEWLKQMIAIAIELILQFGALGLFSLLIMTYMEKTLGYRICWMPLFGTSAHGDLAVVKNSPPFLNTIFPIGVFLPNVTDEKVTNYSVGTDPATGEQILATRYIDAPYLDTENVERDRKQFERVNESRTYYLNPLDILPVLFAIYLVFMFIQNLLPTLSGNLRGAIAGATESVGLYGSGLKAQFTSLAFGTNENERRKQQRAHSLGSKIGSGGLSMLGSGLRRTSSALTGGAVGGFFNAVGKGGKAQEIHTGRRGGIAGIFTAGYKGYDYMRSKLTNETKGREGEKAQANVDTLDEMLKEEESLKKELSNIETAQERQAATQAATEEENVERAGQGETSKKLSAREIHDLQIQKDTAYNQLRNMGIENPETVSPTSLNAQQTQVYQQYLSASDKLNKG